MVPVRRDEEAASPALWRRRPPAPPRQVPCRKEATAEGQFCDLDGTPVDAELCDRERVREREQQGGRGGLVRMGKVWKQVEERST